MSFIRLGTKMKIHYLSDLHLEFYDLTKVPRILQQIVPQSPICVLAGDIGYPFQKTYEAFLRGINTKFEHVFLIHGNHEYYKLKENSGKSMDEIVQRTQEIISTHELNNIHFLNNTHYDLGEHRFIGSTLWSHISNPRFLSNDFRVMYDSEEVAIEELNGRHLVCKEYLRSELIRAKEESKKVIVITHHLPSFRLNHMKYARFLNYHQCFSSHSDDLAKDPVCLWIFGHTHMDIQMRIGEEDVLCVANPIGYKGERVNPNFNASVEI